MRPRSEKTKRILELNSQGMTVAEIADAMGCSRSVVGSTLYRAKEQRNFEKKPLDDQEIRKMAANGKTAAEIAETFGVTADTIRKHLNATGIQVRRIAQRSSEPDCFNCPFPDCRWDSQAAKCPAER